MSARLVALGQRSWEEHPIVSQVLKDSDSLVDRRDDDPRVFAHCTLGNVVSTAVRDVLEVTPREVVPVGATLSCAAAPFHLEHFLGSGAGQVGDNNQGSGHQVHGQVEDFFEVDHCARTGSR